MLHYAARIGRALPFAVTEPVPSRPPRNGGKQFLIWAIKIGVSGGLLYLLLLRVDLGRLWLVARTATLPWLATALVLYFGMVVVSAWRWGVSGCAGISTRHLTATIDFSNALAMAQRSTSGGACLALTYAVNGDRIRR